MSSGVESNTLFPSLQDFWDVAEYSGMSDYSSQLEQLLISKNEGRTTVHTFSSHPTPLEEKNLGTVFGLFETESTDSLQPEVLEGLAREVVETFYHAEQFSPDRALEQSLQHLNQKIQTLLPEVGEDWVKQFAGVVAVVHGMDVHFSAIGRIAAFIIQNSQIVDLHQPSATPPQPLKIFTNLMSGKLNQHSSLFFSTETILDFLSKEKLKRTVADKAPHRVVEELTQLLADDTTNTNFGAIILRLQPADSVSTAQSNIPLIQPESARKDSMYDLVSKEKNTRDLLAPSLWQSMRRTAVQNLNVWRKKQRVVGREMSETEPAESPNVSRLNRAASRSSEVTTTGLAGLAKKAWIILKRIGAAVWRGILLGFSAILAVFRKKPAQRRRPMYSSVTSKTTSGVARVIVWFKALSVSRKILLVTGIVVLFVVAQTVVSKGRNSNDSQGNTDHQQTISQVDVKINEAKAALLYDNEDTARAALTEAERLLSTIPTDSKIYEDQGQSRADTIAQQINAMNKVTEIESPTVIGNFSSINPALNVRLLVKLGASAFTFDASNTSVYRLNTEDKSASVVLSASESAAKVTSVHKASPGTALVSINNKRLGLMNPVAGSIEDVVLEFPNADRSIADAEAFGTRLYALDAQAGQILRFEQTNGEYGPASQWLTDNSVSLVGAKAIAIDGSIYVLQSTGVIVKLFGGKVDGAFSPVTLSPGFEGATDIVTDENTNSIYILDPANKRIVVLDKSGKLEKQITSAAFDKLSGLVVEEADKKLYVLNGTIVYQVDL